MDKRRAVMRAILLVALVCAVELAQAKDSGEDTPLKSSVRLTQGLWDALLGKPTTISIDHGEGSGSHGSHGSHGGHGSSRPSRRPANVEYYPVYVDLPPITSVGHQPQHAHYPPAHMQYPSYPSYPSYPGYPAYPGQHAPPSPHYPPAPVYPPQPHYQLPPPPAPQYNPHYPAPVAPPPMHPPHYQYPVPSYPAQPHPSYPQHQTGYPSYHHSDNYETYPGPPHGREEWDNEYYVE